VFNTLKVYWLALRERLQPLGRTWARSNRPAAAHFRHQIEISSGQGPNVMGQMVPFGDFGTVATYVGGDDHELQHVRQRR